MKKTLPILLLIFVPIFIIGFIPLFPWVFGLCEDRFEFDCIRDIEKSNLFYLAYLTILSPIVFSSCALLILRIKSRRVFEAWKNFAKYYLPVAAVLIVLSAGPSGGSWGVSTNFDAELTTWWLAGIFVLLSAWIIGFGLWQERRQRNEMPQ